MFAPAGRGEATAAAANTLAHSTPRNGEPDDMVKRLFRPTAQKEQKGNIFEFDKRVHTLHNCVVLITGSTTCRVLRAVGALRE